MVRLSKKEKQDKRELLSSLNQMNMNGSKHEADNGEFNGCHFILFLKHILHTQSNKRNENSD